MILANAALAAMLSSCAPAIGPRTMTAIVRVESGGHPLAIHDNTIGRSFAPVDKREAVAWAEQLLRLRHSVDLGIAQINDANLPRLGLSVPDAFEPCANLHAGAEILAYDYSAASAKFGPGQFALRRALGAYNTGSIYEGATYVNRILAAAGIAADNDFRVPDLTAMPGMATRPLGPVPLLPARFLATPKPRPVAVATPRAAPTPDARLPFTSPILIPIDRPSAAPIARATAVPVVPAANGAPTASPAPSNAGARISSLIVDGVGLTHAALSPRSSPVILLIATPPPATPVTTPQPAATAAP